MLPRNIILVGFMASGKSVVGLRLAEATGWPLVDTDAEIVRWAGKPIHQIFQEEGEASFRFLECQVIANLCQGSGRVISAGGGAFVDPQNRQLMRATGLVVCLRVTPETVYRRVKQGQATGAAVRPLLAGDNPLERIASLMSQRAEAYAQAHYTIDADSISPAQVAKQILELSGANQIAPNRE